MEEEASIIQKPTRGAHVLVLPWPIQGHINPMLQFSKRLASKGLKVTIITTTSISSLSSSSQTSNPFNLEFVTLLDGFKEGERHDVVESYFSRFKSYICKSLFELLNYYKQNESNLLGPTPKMVIYDSVMPWVLEVIRECGLKGASFLTQSCLVSSIHYLVYQGKLRTPIMGSLVSLPCVKSLLRAHDLPSIVSCPSTYPDFVKLMLDQYYNAQHADFLFFNSFDKLEIEAMNWMASQWPVKTIGPTIPSMYIDKLLPDDNDYGLSLFKPETDACITWLNAKETSSVVYISMGSMASLKQEQIHQMAMGLEKCNKYFLWVVRADEENKLPQNFKEKISEKGLVVNWCPQLEVLNHPALGCFVTHCGWNSTLEGVSLGVPMVAFPQWTDQLTNAKCITDIWQVGVRVKVNENGMVTSEEMKACIQEVMDGKRALEIRSNALKWKEIAKEAMKEGGSSDKNIEEFVANVLNL